jgi:hypothetical protein
MRTLALLRYGTAADDVLAKLVSHVARAIEAGALDTKWSDLVVLAPGFADDVARSAVEAMLELLEDDDLTHHLAVSEE